ncbi:hypothetical protein [Streptomyces fradiae]|uniref:hypothetical protein n=1 Tax=Streptomyces fradiae TaxID=1906 RepID=UPI003518934E
MTDTPGTPRTAADAVDERIPLRRLAPLAAQHLLPMIAAPVSTVFLVAGTLTAVLLTALLGHTSKAKAETVASEPEIGKARAHGFGSAERGDRLCGRL